MMEHTTAARRRLAVTMTALLAVTLALAPFAVTDAHAVTAAQKKAEASALLDKLNAMNEEVDKASDDYFIALREQEAAQQKMTEAQARIEEATSQIGNLQNHLGTRAKSMYMSGAGSFLDLLLGATSFQALTNNWDMLNAMNQSDADMVTETKALREEVQQKKAEYTEQEGIAKAKAEEARQVKENAEALVAEVQATYDSLSAEAAELLAAEQAAREGSASNGGSSNGGGSSNKVSGTQRSYSGSNAVERAISALGSPYRMGGDGSDGTFDCSGLVSFCITGSFGHPYVSQDFWAMPEVSDPQPGDVVACHSGHCGIYVGNNQMIHAPQTGDVVKYAPIRGKIVRP